VTTEAVFLTSIVDVHEDREVIITLDIPGAFMQSDMDEILHMKLKGVMTELLVRVDPEKYRKFAIKEGGKDVIYEELKKVLCGTCCYLGTRTYQLSTLRNPDSNPPVIRS